MRERCSQGTSPTAGFAGIWLHRRQKMRWPLTLPPSAPVALRIRQRLLCDHQDIERLPRLGQESDAGRQFADTLALARMPRSENNGKQRPAQLDLPCQIDAVHRSEQPHVREDHGDVLSADQQDGKCSFSALTFDGLELLLFKAAPSYPTPIAGIAANSVIRSPRRPARAA